MNSLEEHCDAVKTDLLSDKVTRRKASSGVLLIAPHVAYRQGTAWYAPESKKSFFKIMLGVSLDHIHYRTERACRRFGPMLHANGIAHLLALQCARKASSA